MNYIHGMKIIIICTFVAVLLGCNTPLRNDFPREGGVIKMSNASIDYEIGGNPAGETVLLLHAGFLNKYMWKAQFLPFSQNHRLVLIDLPGHGLSENDTVRLYPADFIKAVMDSLQIQKASLVGVSLGAGCVTDFIIAHPERVNKAVLVAAGISGWEKKFKLDSAVLQVFSSLFGALEKKDTAAAAEIFTKAWFDGPYRTPQQVDDSARSYIYRTTLRNMKKHKVRGWPIFAEPGAIERLSSINLPVLIVHGDKDMPQINKMCAYLEQHIPGAKRVLIPSTGHMLNMEAPEKFNKIVLEFLSDKASMKK